MVGSGLPAVWQMLKLGDLGRIVTGKTPSTKVPAHFGGDVPFVTPSDMDGRKIIADTERYLSRFGVKSVGNSRIPAGAVMLSCIGSDMGKVAIAGRDCVTNQQINSIIIDEKWCADYVYYNLSTRKAEFQSLAGSGSAQPILNKGHFSQILIAMPSLPEQRAIAHILGTLDDKIELNRRMNETLEAAARALFKSWFVDFDPVRAKMEGRQPPGMDAETATLFPDSFEDSPLGKIPKGWRAAPIGELVRVVGGSTPSTKESAYWEGGTIHWATPKDLASLSSPVILDTERRITELGLRQISSGLLPKGTVLLSSRAPIGYLAIAEVPLAINQGFIAMVCARELPNHYVLQWAQVNMATIEGRANGTTFLEISKANFRPIRVVVPPQSILQQFTDQAEGIHQQVVNNLKQSLTLAAIRDTLLPKLLSGEIRVKEVERFLDNRSQVEEVVNAATQSND